jgi:hypothetical protein
VTAKPAEAAEAADSYENRWRGMLDAVADLEREPRPEPDSKPPPQLSLFNREPCK